jgi:hypothetical protein
MGKLKASRFVLAICCVLGVILPTESSADLRNVACKAIRRGCNADCNHGSGSQACYDQCQANYQNCAFGNGSTKKQQTPPPPCTGIRCNLPTKPHPPTTVSDPPSHGSLKPDGPVQPVGKSNPNSPGSSGGNPVILERTNNSGGSQSGGHQSGGGGHGR